MEGLKPLSHFVGRQILRIRRVFFTMGGKQTDAGPLELTFARPNAAARCRLRR